MPVIASGLTILHIFVASRIKGVQSGGMEMESSSQSISFIPAGADEGCNTKEAREVK